MVNVSIRLVTILLAFMSGLFLFISISMTGFWAGTFFGLFLAAIFEFIVFSIASIHYWFITRKQNG